MAGNLVNFSLNFPVNAQKKCKKWKARLILFFWKEAIS